MLRDIDNWFLNKEEPNRSCLQALRTWVLRFDEHITEAWKYRMPFFCYKGKMFCYLWLDKKSKLPYMGIVKGGRIDHPLLVKEKRVRMKVLYFDPLKDLPESDMRSILNSSSEFY